MALCSDAVMALYYDITGDNADHDDWHTYEHMHERLSVPGFVRGTRWVAKTGSPTYMVIYEVSGVDVATSAAYLARLNHPSAWTETMMGRFRRMVRGFCSVVATSGFGLGREAVSVRFAVAEGGQSPLIERLAQDVLPAMASRRGMASVQLLQPAAPPPMTKEQSLRGIADTPIGWLLLATAYDSYALSDAAALHLSTRDLQRYGAAPPIDIGTYTLHFTVTAQEAGRTAPNPPLQPDALRAIGVRR